MLLLIIETAVFLHYYVRYLSGWIASMQQIGFQDHLLYWKTLFFPEEFIYMVWLQVLLFFFFFLGGGVKKQHLLVKINTKKRALQLF